MDSIEITTELNKINRIHSSLDECNPITYIIFQETFRDRLSPLQMDWLDAKITSLNQDIHDKVRHFQNNIDVGLAMRPISTKMEDVGRLLTDTTDGYMIGQSDQQ
jgi:hypothetical protein